MHTLAIILLVVYAIALPLILWLLANEYRANGWRIFNVKRVGSLTHWRYGRLGGSFYWRRKPIDERQVWPLLSQTVSFTICAAVFALGVNALAQSIGHKRLPFLPSSQLRTEDYQIIAARKHDSLFDQCLTMRSNGFGSGIKESACQSLFAGDPLWEGSK